MKTIIEEYVASSILLITMKQCVNDSVGDLAGKSYTYESLHPGELP